MLYKKTVEEMNKSSKPKNQENDLNPRFIQVSCYPFTPVLEESCTIEYRSRILAARGIKSVDAIRGKKVRIP